jgi:TPR repeat protein
MDMMSLNFQQKVGYVCAVLTVLMMGIFFVIYCTNADVKTYRKAAERGDAKAQFNLGDCYFFGQGIKKDYNEAVQWFRKAAEQGHAKAQLRLGHCYYYGKGIKQNDNEAVQWVLKAAEQGDEEAQFGFSFLFWPRL